VREEELATRRVELGEYAEVLVRSDGLWLCSARPGLREALDEDQLVQPADAEERR
jgi:hypothetical protein